MKPVIIIKTQVEKDNGRRGLEYEVDFTSGAEIGFTSDGK